MSADSSKTVAVAYPEEGQFEKADETAELGMKRALSQG